MSTPSSIIRLSEKIWTRCMTWRRQWLSTPQCQNRRNAYSQEHAISATVLWTEAAPKNVVSVWVMILMRAGAPRKKPCKRCVSCVTLRLLCLVSRVACGILRLVSYVIGVASRISRASSCGAGVLSELLYPASCFCTVASRISYHVGPSSSRATEQAAKLAPPNLPLVCEAGSPTQLWVGNPEFA